MKQKRMQIILLAFFFTYACISNAEAGDKAVNGLIIGAGSGAIIGQAAGQNTESVLIGTAIGGAVGYAIGNSMEQHHRAGYHLDRYQPMHTHYDKHRSWKDYQPPHYYRDRSFKYRQEYKRGHSPCRETVTFKKNKGRVSKMVKTTCNRPGFNNHSRDNYRLNRYR